MSLRVHLVEGWKVTESSVTRQMNLRETDTDRYETRTRWNVRDSDATLILSQGALAGGSKVTESVAREMGKAVLHVDLLTMSMDDAVVAIGEWLRDIKGDTLNVAGPRASSDREIYEKTKVIISRLIGQRFLREAIR